LLLRHRGKAGVVILLILWLGHGLGHGGSLTARARCAHLPSHR
jgi:hypothetical protein